MPPIGSFAPPTSASKDAKKQRARPDKPVAAGPPSMHEAPATSSLRSTIQVNGGKKAKLQHRGTDDSLMEPTLTPVSTEPYPPLSPIVNGRREMQFFEKVKKALGRQKINDFLKLCNLYNQNIIDRPTLYQRGASFIAGHQDLMAAWKSLLLLDTQVTVANSKPTPPSDKVSLSNCRGYGPSYRLLPLRVSAVDDGLDARGYVLTPV
jgi:paired amphipathic helix protein Sin3a